MVNKKNKQRENIPFNERKLMLESNIENLISDFQKDTLISIYGIEVDEYKVKNYFKTVMVKVIVK